MNGRVSLSFVTFLIIQEVIDSRRTCERSATTDAGVLQKGSTTSGNVVRV